MVHDLARFLRAQADVYADVVEELHRGHKDSHWMWFVFPQIAGLGHSALSREFGIQSLEEARAYLAHPVLGARLRECSTIVAGTADRSAEQTFGPIDAVKLRSSMTLFHRADPGEEPFTRVLDRCWAGIPDPATDDLLRRA